METGEQAVFDAFPDLAEMRPMGEGFTWDTQDRSGDIAKVRAAWEAAKDRIMDPAWKMVICDELNIALRYDYLPLEEVLETLRARPVDTHVVITGRNAPAGLIEAADGGTLLLDEIGELDLALQANISILGAQSCTGEPLIHAEKAPLSSAKDCAASIAMLSCPGCRNDTNACPPLMAATAQEFGVIGSPW